MVCRSSSRKPNCPDLSFRTPPRGATTRHENVPFLLAHQFSGESKLWRTEIIEEVQDSTPQILVVMEKHPEAGGGGVGGSQEFETVSHLELRWLMEL